MAAHDAHPRRGEHHTRTIVQLDITPKDFPNERELLATLEACMQILRIFLTACIVVGMLAANPAHAGSVVVGVNAWYRRPGMSQEEFIKQLADNGVKTICAPLLPSWSSV
jgi:hypothetical protein